MVTSFLLCCRNTKNSKRSKTWPNDSFFFTKKKDSLSLSLSLWPSAPSSIHNPWGQFHVALTMSLAGVQFASCYPPPFWALPELGDRPFGHHRCGGTTLSSREFVNRLVSILCFPCCILVSATRDKASSVVLSRPHCHSATVSSKRPILYCPTTTQHGFPSDRASSTTDSMTSFSAGACSLFAAFNMWVISVIRFFLWPAVSHACVHRDASSKFHQIILFLLKGMIFLQRPCHLRLQKLFYDDDNVVVCRFLWY